MGIVSVERLLQPLNAWASILANFFESVREVSPLQPSNACSPTDLKESGSARDESALHFLNALSPTLVKPRGNVMEVIPVQPRKAALPE